MSVLHASATTAESAADGEWHVCARRRGAAGPPPRASAGVDVLDIENPFWRFYRIG